MGEDVETQPLPPHKLVSTTFFNTNQERDDRHICILLANFFRETEVTVSIVEHPRFQEIIRFLNPTITLPTIKSVLNTANEDNHQSTSEKQHLPEDEFQNVTKEEMVVQTELVSNEESAKFIVPQASISKGMLPLNLKELPPNDLSIIRHYEPDAELINWPCVVCLKRHHWNKVRNVTMNEACMFMYVSMSEGVYSMEIAQKIYVTVSQLKCCVDHLNPVYEKALKLLNINYPEEIMTAPDDALTEIYSTFECIKSAKNAVVSRRKFLRSKPREKLSGRFRHTLSTLFKNYNPRQRVLSSFVEPNMSVSKLAAPLSPTKYIKQEELEYFGKPRPGEEIGFPVDFLEN